MSELETERMLLAAARIGQRVFTSAVLDKCGRPCVFCGRAPSSFSAGRMLLVGHIKPWDSTPAERLDPCNGLAACAAHDVAFDTGLLAVNGGLRIHVAGKLAAAVRPAGPAVLRSAAAAGGAASPAGCPRAGPPVPGLAPGRGSSWHE